MHRYSREIDKNMEARTMGKDLDISHRHAVVLAKMIRGKPMPKAISLLEGVIEKRVPVRVGQRKAGHKKGRGFGPGKYPVKAASKYLKLLFDAVNNAEQHLSGTMEDFYIVHVSAQKGTTIEGSFPRARGRTTPKRKERVHIELIVRKREEEE